MKNAVDLLATTSRFAIAAAIFYFAFQLSQVSDNAAVVTQSVDQVSRHIEPALEEARAIRLEIAEVRKLVPEILAEVVEVRKQIPVVVAEVAEVRQQIPPIIARVESINRQIDPILQRVDKTVAVVDDTLSQIPQIINMANEAIAALNDTREEALPLMSQALEEIKLSRESVDPTLDRVEDLVEDAYFKAKDAIDTAENAGRKASEGAVKGFFTGLIKLPFELVGTLASPIVKSLDSDVAKQLTEKDIILMLEAGNRAVQSNKIDKERRWENPNSGNSGSIAIIRKFKLEGLECVEVRIRINNKRKQIQDRLDQYCLDEENNWTSVQDNGPVSKK
jgi:surface antigen/regulator of replication initiation timing